MKIAFWNINKKELSDLIVDFALENDLDIICIAEAEEKLSTISNFLLKINLKSSSNKYVQISSIKDKVIILTRYTNNIFEDKSSLYKSNRLVAQRIKIPTIFEINLIAIHFHSKNNWTDISLAMECATAANAIATVERNTKNTNTILIGDFNMNPFESGMVAANGLHAIPDLEYAIKNIKGREIDDTYYSFFYNPMWNFFGDYIEPIGTYYYRASGNVSYEWHIFDQVLLRPSFKNHLDKDSVKIITKIGSESLVNSLKRPDSSQYSDHLPIILDLKL